MDRFHQQEQHSFILPQSLIKHFCQLAVENPDLPCFNFFGIDRAERISPYVLETFRENTELLEALEVFGIYNFSQIRKEYPQWVFVIRKRRSKIIITIDKWVNGIEMTLEKAVNEALMIYLHRL